MKTTFRCFTVAAALVLAAASVTAQPGPGASAPRGGPMGGPMGASQPMGASGPMAGRMASGPVAGRMASGPMAGRMASGPMGGRMMGGRSGSDYTPGWALMTRQERQEHQARMRDVKTRAECESLRDEHRKLMEERAREKGRTLPGQPRRDPCAGLK